MPILTVAERAERVQRAKAALKALSAHPATTQQQLGYARELLNLIYRVQDLRLVSECADTIENLAATVADQWHHQHEGNPS